MRLEGDPAVVAGTKDAKDAELALRGERPRHDVRILAVRLVELRRRPRGQRARRVLENRERAGALDFQKLAEMPVAGKEDHAFDALAHKPVGERGPLGGEVLPPFEAGRAIPELPAAGDD